MFKKSTTVLSAALGAAMLLPAMLLPVVAMAADAPAAPASPHTVTGNVGLFSQYVFRGLTQTNEKLALQGGADYAHSSGFYAGLWGSNISWISDGYAPGSSYSLELDTYLGFKNAIGTTDFSYDVGFLRYNYPGTQPVAGFALGTGKADTNELYGALGWKWITAKYSYSLGDTFGVKDARGSDYLDLSAAVPLGDSGFTLGLHVGKQRYSGTNAPLWAGSGCANNSCLDYTDYKVGLNKDWGGFTWGLAFTNTNAKALSPTGVAIYQNIFGKNVGRSQAVLSVGKTF